MDVKAKTVTQEVCLRSFDYDPYHGVLLWLKRPHVGAAANARFAGKEAGTVMVTADGKSYRKVCVDRVQILAHRCIWLMVHGSIPEGMEIDHQDGNGLNNRLSNLRLVSHGTNMRNAKRKNTNLSGVSGVRRAATKSERWQAFANVDGKFHHLGVHESFDAAVMARKAFAAVSDFHANHGTERPL